MAVTSIAPVAEATLDAHELARMDAYWRAANYLSVGQIYLKANPLLREPLAARARQAAPARALGHDPGPELRLRAPQPRSSGDATSTRSTSPGRGTAGPGWSPTPTSRAPTARSTRTSRRTPRACGGCSSSSRSRAASRATWRPRCRGRSTRAASSATRSRTRSARRSTTRDLVAACVIGDGEAETGPLAASWHSNKFLDPVRDGAVLPILHLNGYKISNPTVLARIEPDELESLLVGYGWKPYFVEGSDPEAVHRQMAETLDRALDEIAEIQVEARASGISHRPRWPMIVLRTPKGWTGPKEVDGQQDRGPLALAPGAAGRAREPARPPRGARGVDAQLPARGALRRRRPARPRAARARARRATGAWARTRTPTAGSCCAACGCPTSATSPSTSRRRARRPGRPRACSAASSARSCGATGPRRTSGMFAPGRERVEPPAGAVRHDRQDVAGARAARRRGPRRRRTGHGDPLRAHLPGLARGLPADRPARAVLVLRGVHPHRRLDVQPARQVAEDHPRARLAARRSRRSTTS